MERPLIALRVPPDLLERLRQQATKENRPLSNLIVTLLQISLAARERRVTQ